MPTKRTRVNRTPETTVTDRAVELCREALPLHEKYSACMSTDKCPGTVVRLGPGHCPDCLRYLDLSAALQLELGIRPWEPHPFDQDSPFHAELMRKVNSDG